MMNHKTAIAGTTSTGRLVRTQVRRVPMGWRMAVNANRMGKIAKLVSFVNASSKASAIASQRLFCSRAVVALGKQDESGRSKTKQMRRNLKQ